MGLDLYNKKRDFKKTSEPRGILSKENKLRFVVQEHHASNLHFDLRLEMEGVLKSWAVPKAPSLNPSDRRLAMMTEDHPVAYLKFFGAIPKGEYGGGEMRIWDTGTYKLLEGADPVVQLNKGSLVFALKGKKLKGRFRLIRTSRERNQWLLIKSDDEHAESGWEMELLLPPKNSEGRSPTRRVTVKSKNSKKKEKNPKKQTLSEVPGAMPGPMPKRIDPMLSGICEKPFNSPDWLFEIKWDGVRAVCYIANGKVRFVSRSQQEMTFRYPELSDIPQSIDADEAILDGEIVAPDETGYPSFQKLQARIGLTRPAEIARLAKEKPVVFYAFDLLYYNGYNLMPAAVIHRKSLLEKIVTPGESLKYSGHVVEYGKDFYREAEKMKIEGIVGKLNSGPYVQKRSKDWLKIKTVMRQELVIAGYTTARSGRSYFGALVVGLYKAGKLRYVGHVGGGFNQKSLKQIHSLLQPLKVEKSPFEKAPKTNEPVQWVRPKLVCEVKFTNWTADGMLRQPIFLGLRDDKDPSECVVEQPNR